MILKHLYTKKTGGELPMLVAAQTENMQTRFIVQHLLKLREEGVPIEEIAVLFRSSFHSFDLEVELNKANIPFRKYGGFKFIETAHIKDILAYLRVLQNPRDVVAWHRILLLIDGVGPRTTEKIIDDINKRRHNVISGNEKSVKFWSDFHHYPPKVQKLFSALKDVSASNLTPGEKAYQIQQYYFPILRDRYDDHPKRKKDIEMFINIAERYKDVETLLTDLALEPPSGSVTDIKSPGPEDEFLTLSTIHSAKGLEWHTVFVIYALEGRFPTFYSASDEEEMEEERRLMYVACTRAKQNLIITYPINVYDRESGVILTKPSRFIEGISEHLLEQWTLDE